jgi:hypothetical protein
VLHDFEFIHGAPFLVQHEEHSRGNLEDSVNAVTTAYRFAQIQLRHMDVAAAEARGSGIFAA